MLLLLSTAVAFSLTTPLAWASSCNVTATECATLTVDLVQLQVTDETEIVCLHHLSSLIGALTTSSSGEGLVVDAQRNSSVLLLVPLTQWEELDTNNRLWSISDGECWLQLTPILGFEGSIHEMDVHDHLVLKAELSLNDTGQHIVRAISLLPEYFWFVEVHLEEPGVFDYKVDTQHTRSGRNITVDLWQKNSDPTLSDVQVSWMYAPSYGCAQTQLTATIRSGCPREKEFRFIYPDDQADSQLVRLPVNYRPPSPLGSSLPTSPHIYHAEPSKPLTKTHFQISQNAEYKQCQGEECNCTLAMEQSQDIQFSDCIHKVYGHPFQQPFQLEFTISLGEGREEQVRDPITITEVNGRTSFTIRGLKDGYIQPENRGSVSIVFEGPELFHFEAKVATNTSFCNLTTYFIVYVDRVPLLRAAEYSIIVTSTVVFGAVTLIMYLLHHFKLSKPHY